jgi:hypothetical protein
MPHNLVRAVTLQGILEGPYKNILI